MGSTTAADSPIVRGVITTTASAHNQQLPCHRQDEPLAVQLLLLPRRSGSPKPRIPHRAAQAAYGHAAIMYTGAPAENGHAAIMYTAAQAVYGHTPILYTAATAVTVHENYS